MQIFKLYNIIEENNMNILNIHIIYIGIIFLILIKSFIKKKEIKEIKKPTLEYYEWKRLYFKMMVLHKFNELYKNHKIKQNFKKYYKHKLRKSIICKSANF